VGKPLARTILILEETKMETYGNNSRIEQQEAQEAAQGTPETAVVKDRHGGGSGQERAAGHVQHELYAHIQPACGNHGHAV